MPGSNPRENRGDNRRQLILEAARARAESDGWAAVTTRHLAEAIGYTQPVLYQHFPGGKTEIMRAVAFEGIVELTNAWRAAVGRKTGARAIVAVATAYLDFATEHPALYEAMFLLPIEARFAQEDAELELRTGFDTLSAALGLPADDGGATTEVFWGALHGICLLERAGRMRREHRSARVAELAARFCR